MVDRIGQCPGGIIVSAWAIGKRVVKGVVAAKPLTQTSGTGDLHSRPSHTTQAFGLAPPRVEVATKPRSGRLPAKGLRLSGRRHRW